MINTNDTIIDLIAENNNSNVFGLRFSFKGITNDKIEIRTLEDKK